MASSTIAPAATTNPLATVCSPKSFDVSRLPSLIKDGMSVEEESDRRRKTCRFIEEAGRILKLPRVAVSTAMVFFHRFYAKHAFSTHDRFEVAVASLLLAAKTEESPKKLNVIIDECYKLKVRGMQAGRMSAASTPTPLSAAAAASASSGASSSSLDPKSEEFLKLKERILLLERVLLHTIGFELSIDHPYKFLVEQIKRLVHGRKIEYIPGSPGAKETEKLPTSQAMSKMMNQMVQWAMNFANDSLQTTLCLQFEPQEIATATVYLAGQFAKIRPVNKSADWLEVLYGHDSSTSSSPDIETLTSICLQIIELIADRKGSDEAAFTKIRRDLETLKQEKQRSSNPPVNQHSPLNQPEAKRQKTGP